jgi:hypothetical protein
LRGFPCEACALVALALRGCLFTIYLLFRSLLFASCHLFANNWRKALDLFV